MQKLGAFEKRYIANDDHAKHQKPEMTDEERYHCGERNGSFTPLVGIGEELTVMTDEVVTNLPDVCPDVGFMRKKAQFQKRTWMNGRGKRAE